MKEAFEELVAGDGSIRGEFGPRLLCSPDGEEQTTVGYSIVKWEMKSTNPW